MLSFGKDNETIKKNFVISVKGRELVIKKIKLS